MYYFNHKKKSNEKKRSMSKRADLATPRKASRWKMIKESVGMISKKRYIRKQGRMNVGNFSRYIK